MYCMPPDFCKRFLTWKTLFLRSICYQLPACLLGGVTIVISPLLALMKDQMEALNEKGIPVACINSSQTETEKKAILERVVPSLFNKPGSGSNGKVASTDKTKMPTPVLLYITPESIQTDRMRTVLKRLYDENRLALFGVDEAHCLSSWGHDFRPAYRRLNYLRIHFPHTPCMALTATATPNVIKDITNELSLQNCPLHVGTFDRPNIFYKVVFKDAIENPLHDLIQSILKTHRMCDKQAAPCSGIVYVHKREETSMIAAAISKAGISASGYHAGLKKVDRLAVQEGWSNGTIQVAVATGTCCRWTTTCTSLTPHLFSHISLSGLTVAFGMGIDK
jgi:ATP-dependent DNA helicase RecQ